MNEKFVLVISSIAAFSLTLTSILCFRKARENIGFAWLGLLFFSPALPIVSNMLIYLKSGNTLLLHVSMMFNLSWGGFLILTFNNLRKPQKRFFNPWLLMPTALYLPFVLYSLINPQVVHEIVKGQFQSDSFLVTNLYNLVIVSYSVLANILLMIRELKERHLSAQHAIRAEILGVMLVLQTLAFIPYLLKFDALYIILYMPVFGQLFFLYTFFRLSPEKTITLLHPSVKGKYTGLKISMERKNELENKIQDLMNEKKLFLREDCSLQMIAGELNESPNAVSMIVNAHFNKSFPDFVNCYRVKLAIDLLQSGNKNLTIEGIAYECGFGNKTSFYKAFKKETGSLPTEYLKTKRCAV